MSKIKLAVFDLSGTTIQDDIGVRDSLYEAAVEFKLETTADEILLHMGTNKIHLYQFLIARARGQAITTSTAGPHGGNMDYRGFRQGATIWFPVSAPSSSASRRTFAPRPYWRRSD